MKLLQTALVVCALSVAVDVHGQGFSPKESGATLKTVSVTASNQATQACASISDGCTVSIPTDAASGVWLSLVNKGTACTAVTQKRGVYLAPGNSYVCDPYELGGYCHNWIGQTCLILNTGSTAVSAEVTER